MAKLLKDLYNLKYLGLLAQNSYSEYIQFDKDLFLSTVFNDEWDDKELKQRMRHIAITLYTFLPKEYKTTVEILEKTFTKMPAKYNLENMIFQDYVGVYGLNDFKTSMQALQHFTIESSSEFAIREFILKYPQQTLQQMKIWAVDSNYHVRRLASEGLRPRLPWARALVDFKNNPREIISILELLNNDESLYVRKSVANNLNDISKDNPTIVKNITKQWIGNSKKTDWILKHACRSLLKSGDKETLEIFGYIQSASFEVDMFEYLDKVELEEELNFSFMLRSNEALGKLRVEYVIEFLRQNNKSSQKVFHIADGIFSQKEKLFSKSYSFKHITTRKYYKGEHKLALIVNGLKVKEVSFILY